jgi:hypothetical protein
VSAAQQDQRANTDELGLKESCGVPFLPQRCETQVTKKRFTLVIFVTRCALIANQPSYGVSAAIRCRRPFIRKAS